MNGETARSGSSWTVDTLKDHLIALISETEKRLKEADRAADLRNDQRFDAQQEAVKDALTAQKEATAAALASSEKAVMVAEVNAEKWRASANEWRGAMNDRERTLMPRPEAEAMYKSNAEKIDALQARMDRNEGKSAMGYPALEQAMKEVATLRSQQSEAIGAKGGRVSQQQLITWILGVIIALAAIAAYLKKG